MKNLLKVALCTWKRKRRNGKVQAKTKMMMY